MEYFPKAIMNISSHVKVNSKRQSLHLNENPFMRRETVSRSQEGITDTF